MGHDAHFLSRLDRAQTDEVELALGLYRDHEATRFVLDRLNVEAERIALSIGERGPYIVVARDGGFVTCLGKGMSTGALPIVPRGRLDALLRKHSEQKGRENQRRLEQRKNEGLVDFFRRMMRRGHAMNREDFVAFSAIQPLLASEFYRRSIQSSLHVLANARTYTKLDKISPGALEAAEALYSHVWLAGHEIVLATMGERSELDWLVDYAIENGQSISFHCAGLSSTAIVMRGAWAAARLGKRLVPAYRAALASAETFDRLIDAMVGLVAIARRHDGARKDVARALEAAPSDGQMLKVYQALLPVAKKALAGDYDEAALELGRCTFFDTLAAHLPEGDPYRFASKAEVPAEIARTTALWLDLDFCEREAMTMPFVTVSLLADLRAEDFYFPRELARRVVYEWYPELTLSYARRLTHDVSAVTTVQLDPRPGRNDPCPCGSGKKFKKCCA